MKARINKTLDEGLETVERGAIMFDKASRVLRVKSDLAEIERAARKTGLK